MRGGEAAGLQTSPAWVRGEGWRGQGGSAILSTALPHRPPGLLPGALGPEDGVFFPPRSAAEAEHLDFYQELLGCERDLEDFEALDERPLGNAGLNFY